MPTLGHRTSTRLALVLCSLLTLSLAVHAEQESPPANDGGAIASGSSDTLGRLSVIREQLLSNRSEMEALRKELATTRNEERIAHIEQRLSELPKSIEALNRSFEQVALGGIDMGAFTEQPEIKFEWKDELIEVVRPLLGSLKDLTEKPRKIEQLRQQIERAEQRLEVTQRALASIDGLRQAAPPTSVASKLDDMAENWLQRQKDLSAELNLAHYQISTLQGEATSTWEAISQSLRAFFKGRGLTLLIAAITVALVWLMASLLLRLSRRRAATAGTPPSRRLRTRQRVFNYIYQALTAVAMLIALLAVFYLRSDLVLLALTLIVVVVVALTLRETLPKYVKEIRLLLDFGSVREGERIIYNGLPLEVRSVNAFTILRNPELEGEVRLPLALLTDQISRPAGDEEWFPCSVGDFLLFPDGRIAEVLRLTLERVQLRMARSTVHCPTTDFLAMEYRNLSRTGFAVPTTFGIDYQHQAICLDVVPRKMQAAVEQAMKDSPWAAQFVELLVEFKEAGANSLDYLVYVSMRSEVAGSYYNIARLVQRSLVELCNREGWVIPFAQLTVHQGEGFDSLRTKSE